MRGDARDTFSIAERAGAVITTAIHAGHDMSPEVAAACALPGEQRTLEEDPATDRIADIGATQVVVHTSRFQVDLNRTRECAIYRGPDDAWGLNVWREPVCDEHRAASLAQYDRFYAAMLGLIERTIATHGYALILDVHSYNHRREGRNTPSAPQEQNPDVNVGTGSLDPRFAVVAQSLTESLSAAGFDTRENVKFAGGAFVRWVHATFPDAACALAVEFKKTFMDEWTGAIDTSALEAARDALRIAAFEAESRLRDVVA